jgi:YfiH family protein
MNGRLAPTHAIRDFLLGEDALNESVAVLLEHRRDARDVGGIDAKADDGGHPIMILPRPGDDFEWRDTTFGPALVCVPLEGVAPHLFTTRAWTLGRQRTGPSAWAEVAQAVGVSASALTRLKQVHGSATLVAEDSPDDRSADEPLGEADVVLTANDTRAVVVQGADCIPLLLADRATGVVAAAHAGWRGLALRVPSVAVQALAARYRSRPGDLIAAIGPAVGACCYEVGSDVRQAFAQEGFSESDIAAWFHETASPTARNPSMPGLPPEPRPGRAYFDGWACARAQLLQSGLDPHAIFTAGLCTASHPGVLCSYRREGIEAGRIAGAIRPRPRS